MKKIIDLHIHTNLSDGSFSYKEVIDMAIENGVSVISITDHDTCDVYNDELYDYINNKNIKIITGVEISTKYKGIGIHILGYNFDINNQELKEKLSILRNARHKYLYDVSVKLKELGYVLDVLKLSKIKAVTKAHIAYEVVNNPINHNRLLEEFNHIPNSGEFIETIMNENCKAYVKKESITPMEASSLIKNAGGKVVLAHPVAYIHEDNLNDNDILKLIKDIQVDGIEANYIYIDRNNNKINDSKKWQKVAKDNNLIATTGSDFHNKDGIHPEIGLINEFLDDVNTIDIITKIN